MIQINVQGADKLAKQLKNARKQLPREMAIVINKTARWGVTYISRRIRQDINVKSKDLKQKIAQKRKANKRQQRAMIQLDHEARLTLKAHSPRQTKKGVSYKIEKGEKRKMAEGAFLGPSVGRSAVKLKGIPRKRRFRSRKPIIQLHGLSPWAAFKKRKLRRPTERAIKKELKKQMKRRIRYRVLKKRGLI